MKLLEVKYNNISFAEALSRISDFMESSKAKTIYFLNADSLRISQEDEEYRDILNVSDLVLPDGIGLKILTKLYGGNMVENCNGTDLSPRIIKLAAEKQKSIFFFGGEEGVASSASENLKSKFPNLVIAGTHSGFDFENDDVVELINESGASILFVALGVPLQEKWISRNKKNLEVNICIGVGALLDYLSLKIPRAPLWMRKLQIEWLWRIYVDPKRMIKRYLIHGLGFMFKVGTGRILASCQQLIGGKA